MSAPTISATKTAPAAKGLPLLLCFDNDAAVLRVLAKVQRFRKVWFRDQHTHPPEIERVMIISSEQFLRDHLNALRAPNMRVLALADDKFKDPRLDGTVYAYLPPA